jgi:hypothetical protein
MFTVEKGNSQGVFPERKSLQWNQQLKCTCRATRPAYKIVLVAFILYTFPIALTATANAYTSHQIFNILSFDSGLQL